MHESSLRLLLGVRLLLLRNRLHQIAREQPLKLAGSAGSVLLIWAGLYFLLVYALRLVRRPVLEGIVATPLIFTFFFLALTGMLAFSSAILCYGSLFRRSESAYLMASPVNLRDVVIVNFVESLLLSSWSLVLLGLPLMMAVASVFKESWSFYPLFLGLFLLFIPLPGALGLLLAWGAAMLFPKTPRRTMVLLAAPIVALTVWWTSKAVYTQEMTSLWLKSFYDRMALIQNSMLPHTWVSKGINHAVQGQVRPALFYLFVTFANALFLSLIAVAVVARGYVPAFVRGQASGARSVHRTGWLSSWVGEILFVYMPWRQRLLAAKDLKTFFRDPLQWSQMAILFGLLALYVSNVQRMWTDMGDPRLQMLIAFLNLTAVSLILATFTNRFLFPLVSLDGQHLWLLGLLPLARSRLILAKFQYALTITLLAALAVMGVSVGRLQLASPVIFAHLVATASICVGLCGVSIGLGARLPLLGERNPARIAGGFGGTVSLLASVGLVVLSLTSVGLMSYKALEADYGEYFSGPMLLWLIVVVVLNVAGAAIALTIGIRHFTKVEC
jgi:ABC-2 type transport system permease protein